MPDRSKLGDLIVEHGPFALGQHLRAGIAGAMLGALNNPADLNALRDELIELRRIQTSAEDRPEDPRRFQVEGLATCEDAQLLLSCDNCGPVALSDEPLTLAELNLRADEHAEVCR